MQSRMDAVARHKTQEEAMEQKMNKRAGIAKLRALANGMQRTWAAGFALAALFACPTTHAQETVCARVKIEIKQELTLERQAFDAEMKITNQLDGASLTDVGVVVKVTDETRHAGFHHRRSEQPERQVLHSCLQQGEHRQCRWHRRGRGVVDRDHQLAADSSARARRATSPVGKKYLVGATLHLQVRR